MNCKRCGHNELLEGYDLCLSCASYMSLVEGRKKAELKVEMLEKQLQEIRDYKIPDYCDHTTGYFALKKLAEGDADE